MTIARKLTTAAACRVARLNRDRFNEFVAAGAFDCAPRTVPGRSRLFDPDDMIALWLFSDLMGDGLDAHRAGKMACLLAQAAREHPNEPAISYVEDYFYAGGIALPTSAVPPADTWSERASFICPGDTDIRKSTTFRMDKLRQMIAHYTEVEFSTAGEPD